MRVKTCRIEFVCTPDERERWNEQAHQEKIPLSRWIRRRLNGEAMKAERIVAIAKEEPVLEPKSNVCAHRLQIGAYCKKCGVLKKKGDVGGF